jgi:hypothetical protein
MKLLERLRFVLNLSENSSPSGDKLRYGTDAAKSGRPVS